MISLYFDRTDNTFDFRATGMGYHIGGDYEEAVDMIESICDSYGEQINEIQEYAYTDNSIDSQRYGRPMTIDVEPVTPELAAIMNALQNTLENATAKYDFVELRKAD